MAFSYNDWKKKQKKTAPKVQSYDDFKSSRKPSVEPTRNSVATYESFQESKRAERWDAQAPKSDRARQADADRFARGHTDPASEKSRQADADRFSGMAQANYRRTSTDEVEQGKTASKKDEPKKNEKASLLSKMLDPFKTAYEDLGIGDVTNAYNPKTIINNGEVKAFTDKNNENDTLVEKRNANLRLGIGDTLEGLGQGIGYLDKKLLGENDLLLSKGAKLLEKAGQKVNEGFEENTYSKEFSGKSLTDPEWYATSVTRAVPNAASSIVPGLATAKILGNVNKIAKLPTIVKVMVQSVGGAGATTAYDSALLSGGIYDEAKKRGMSEDEAMSAADKAFWQNSFVTGGMTALEFGLGLTPFTKGISSLGKAASIGARTAGGGLAEGFQEGAQTGIEANALGDKFSWTDASTIEAMIIGGLLGGTMTGSMATYGAMKDAEGNDVAPPPNNPGKEARPLQEIMESSIADLPTELQEQFDDAVFTLREQGIELEEAREVVFEEMAKRNPEIQEVIAKKSVEYKENKVLEQETKANNPVTQMEKQAKAETQQQTETAKAQDFINQLEQIKKINETVANEDGTLNTKALEQAQQNVASPNPIENAPGQTEVLSETFPQPVQETVSNEPKTTQNEAIDVSSGDKVNLQGTKAVYEVQETTPTEAKVKTPKGKTITIPKSRIAQVVERANEPSFGDEVENTVVQDLPSPEQIGEVQLPPNFRNDVKEIINEFVNEEGMTVDQAVQSVKEDDYYRDNPEWAKIIEEEAGKHFGYKSKAKENKAPKQAKNDDSTPSENPAKVEVAEAEKKQWKKGQKVYLKAGNQPGTIEKVENGRALIKTESGKVVAPVSELLDKPKEIEKLLTDVKKGDMVRDKRPGFGKDPIEVVDASNDRHLMVNLVPGRPPVQYSRNFLEKVEPKGKAVETKPKKQEAKAEEVSEQSPIGTPEQIAKDFNEKTWYHGSRSSELSKESLDPFATKITSLFGLGFYMTEDISIAKNYADGRQSRKGDPTIYKIKTSAERVLNLETVPSQKVFNAITSPFAEYLDQSNDVVKQSDTIEETFDNIRMELSEQDIPSSELVDSFGDVLINLLNLGYDGYTHTGGKRTGYPEHRVFILFDPNNVINTKNDDYSSIAAFEKISNVETVENKKKVTETNDWKESDTAFLGSSNKKVVIKEINGKTAKVTNELGNLLTVPVSQLKAQETHTPTPVSMQGAKVQKEVIKEKANNIPEDLQDIPVVQELQKRVNEAKTVDEMKAWNKVLQSFIKNDGVEPYKKGNTFKVQTKGKTSTSVTNREKQLFDLFTLEEIASLDKVRLSDRNGNEITLDRAQLEAEKLFSEETVATKEFPETKVTVMKDENSKGNVYLVLVGEQFTRNIRTTDYKDAKNMAEDVSHRARHIGRYFVAGYEMKNGEIKSSLNPNEFEILDVDVSEEGVRYKIADLKSGKRAFFKPSLTDDVVYDVPTATKTAKAEPETTPEAPTHDYKVGQTVERRVKRSNGWGWMEDEILEIEGDHITFKHIGMPSSLIRKKEAGEQPAKIDLKTERDIKSLAAEYKKNPKAFRSLFRGEIVPVGDGTQGNMAKSIVKGKEAENVYEGSLIDKISTSEGRIDHLKERIEERKKKIDKLTKEIDKGNTDDFARLDSEREQERLAIITDLEFIQREEKNLEEKQRYDDGKNNSLLFLTSQKETAEAYSSALSELDEEYLPEGYNPTVFEIKAKLENTFTMPKGVSGTGKLNFDEIAEMVEHLNIPDDVFDKIINNTGIFDETGETHSYLFFRGENGKIFPKYLVENGYDSLNFTEGVQDNFVILDRNKVLFQEEWKENENKAEKKAPVKDEAPTKDVIDRINWFNKKMREGTYIKENLKNQFEWARDNEAEIKEALYQELKKSPKHKRKHEATKREMADRAYKSVLESPAYGDKHSVSFRYDVFGDEAKQKESYLKQLEEKVHSITDESIASFREGIQLERDEKKRMQENPETIKDFIYKRDTVGLTPEEQAKYDELVALRQKEKQAEKKVPSKEVISKGEYTITPDKDSRDNSDIWIVKPKEKLDKAEYMETVKSMKALGGYYSRFKKGFLFKEDPTAKLEGDISEEILEPGGRDAKRIADRLRGTAENMQKTIDDKRNDNRLTNTHKRATQDAYAREEADRLEIQQGIMNRVADAIESGEATFLDNVTARTHIETLQRIVGDIRRSRWQGERMNPNEIEKAAKQPITEEEINNLEMPKVNVYADNLQYVTRALTGTKGLGRSIARLEKEIHKAKGNANHLIDAGPIREDLMKVVDAAIRLDKEKWHAESIKERFNVTKRLEAMNLNTVPLLRSGIREFIRYTEDVGENTDQKQKDARRKKEAELSKLNIPGFFPTPSKIISRMVEEADIQPGMTVLEPSAGKGNIAAAIRDIEGVELDVVEYNFTLADYLKSEGYNVVGNDFLEFEGEYDRILMNPPFENLQDVDHVKHAYEMLKPGGRLVAIMSESPFFNSNKKATEFRKWLEENDGVSEPLEEGSFKDSERTTGVATRIVTIDKAEQKPKPDRDTYIIERVGVEPFVIKRGDKVKFMLSSTRRMSEVVVKSISHAKKEINGHDANLFYPLEYQEKYFTEKLEAMTDYHYYKEFQDMITSDRWYEIKRKSEHAEQTLMGDDVDWGLINDLKKQAEKLAKERIEARKVPAKPQSEPEKTLSASDKKQEKIKEKKKGVTYTENGTKIEFEYRIVEAENLIISNDVTGNVNPNYPKELQPRDRSRKASQIQVQKIAQQLNPALLGESSKASDGAPIVGPDLVVESGNGRTMALLKMYQEGYDTKEAYTDFLTEFATEKQVGFSVLSTDPILVRVRTNEVDRKQFVSEANESNVSSMSAPEQAVVDAEKMNNKLMSLFFPGENGDLNVSTNRAFITAFMGDVVATNERPKYMNQYGGLSQDGLIRVRNAVFTKAYGSNEAISLLAESTDNNVRNVINAMLQVAPKFAVVKDAIKDGTLYDADITSDLVSAMVKLAELRSEGTKVDTFLDQVSMFDELSPEAKEMLRILDDKTFKRSAKALAELFNQYVHVLETAGNPNQIKLFDEAPPTKADILTVALKRVRQDETGEVQTSLFETEDQDSNEAGATSSQKRQSQNETFVGTRRKVENKNFKPKEEPTNLDSTVTRSDIIKFIQKNFKVAVGIGKTRKPKGLYKNKRAVIRSKDFGDFEVIAHELGHHIDFHLGLSSDPKIREELIKFAKANLEIPDSMPKSRIAKEGVAEYFRQVLHNDQAVNMDIAELSEKLHQTVTEGMNKKGWSNSIVELREKTFSWMNRDAEQELRGIVNPIGNKPSKRSFKRYMMDVYTQLFDKEHPIWVAEKLIEKELKERNVKLPKEAKAYVMAVMTRGTVARAVQFTKMGTFKTDFNRMNNEFEITGESLEDILKDIPNPDEFGQYLVAKHGYYLKTEKGKSKTPISEELIQTYLSNVSPETEALAQRIYDYQHRLLDVLVDGGLIDKDLPEKLKEEYPFYVPFYRDMSESGDNSNPFGDGSSGFANQQQGIKKMSEQGSSRNIINPIESIVKNTHLYFALADRNAVGMAMASWTDPDNDFATEVARDLIEEIPNKFQVTNVALEQLHKTLLNAGLDEDMLDGVNMEETTKIFTPIFKPSSAENEILVWNDGKPKLFKVRDDSLYKAMVNHDNQFFTKLMDFSLFKLAGNSNKVLRWGITASPFFTVRTFVRSLFQMLIKTNAKGTNYFLQLPMIGKAMWDVGKKNNIYQEWMASGSGQSTMIAIERNYLDKSLEKISLNQKTKNMLKFKYQPESTKDLFKIMTYMGKNVVASPFVALQNFNDTLDQALKLSEYKVVKKQTKGDIQQSVRASRDADLDYARMGGTGMKFMNSMTLFFNISFQGVDNVAREWSKHKVRTTMRGLIGVTLPTILLFMKNYDDEEYWEQNSYERDLNWTFKMEDGTFVKIPIPFELGILFKTIPEKLAGDFMDFTKGEDKQSWKDFYKNIGTTLAPSLTPTIYDVTDTYKTKMNQMDDRSLIPMYLEGKKPEDQYTENTSEAAKWLGKKLKKSPIIIEATFNAQFAQMGQAGLYFTDKVIEGTGLAERPDTEGLKRNYVERYLTTSIDDGSTASTTTFYEKLKQLEAEHKSDGISGDPSDELVTYRKAGDDMRDLRKVRDGMLYDKLKMPDGSKFSKAEKKRRIDTANAGIRDIARYVQGKEPLDQAALIESLKLIEDYSGYEKAVKKQLRQEKKMREAQEKATVQQ